MEWRTGQLILNSSKKNRIRRVRRGESGPVSWRMFSFVVTKYRDYIESIFLSEARMAPVRSEFPAISKKKKKEKKKRTNSVGKAIWARDPSMGGMMQDLLHLNNNKRQCPQGYFGPGMNPPMSFRISFRRHLISQLTCRSSA